jgi:YggT family protein
MAYKIISFLLDVAAGLIGGACLLRLYMQYQRVPFGNPVGRFVFALTDWLILPLRRVLPSIRRWDTASLVAVFLVELAQYGLLWLLLGRPGAAPSLLGVALFGVVRLALSALMALVIVNAVLSWVRADSPIVDMIERLGTPLLRPFRRHIPLVGGIDLTPLVVLVLIQVAIFVLWSVDCVVDYSRQGLDRPLDIIVGFASVSLDPAPQMSRLDWSSVVVGGVMSQRPAPKDQ